MKILLVDDEPFALRTLNEMISDNNENWDVIAAVEDGEEAISVLQSNEIDLVISDIRMPSVDGLELSKYISENFIDIKVILLTGYKDFEFAQQALRYGVVDFILKPCPFDSLFETIEKIEKNIESEKSSLKIMQKRKRDILEKRLDDLLFGIPLPHYDNDLIPIYDELIVLTCSFTNLPHDWEINAYAALKNIAEEWFITYGETFAIIQDQHLAIILFLKDFKEKVISYEDLLYSFYKSTYSLLKLNLFIGCSVPSHAIDQLNSLYRESIHQLEFIKKNHSKPIIFSAEIKSNSTSINSDFEQKYELKKNKRVIEIVLENMETRLSEDLSLKLLAEEVYLNPTYLGRIFKKSLDISFSNYLIHLRMEKAKELLKDPFLKVYEVCEKVGYGDPAHFTHIFKKTVGMTPQEYKNQKRDAPKS